MKKQKQQNLGAKSESNARRYLKKIALHSCVYYTAVTFFVLFLYVLLMRDLSRGLQAFALIMFLPFSICFASANIIYRETPLSKWARVTLHYLLTVGGAYVFLYLPNKDPQQSGAAALVLFLIFTLIYVIIMSIVLGVSSRIHRVKRDEEKYHNVYKK